MRGEIIQKLNLEDRKVFRRWLWIYRLRSDVSDRIDCTCLERPR
jgi:hypothetical protein